jgi:hypothetical protein
VLFGTLLLGDVPQVRREERQAACRDTGDRQLDREFVPVSTQSRKLKPLA